VDGVLKHSLYNEVLISLGKRQADEFLDAPWKYNVEISDAITSEPLDDRDTDAIYDATGLLLILGEPGSGKTTTLLQLARTLLERARVDIKERVPIVVSLSSWQKKQPLFEWISGELSEKYRVPRKIAHSWLQNGYLLPLLDGLDEVETTLQADCVTSINTFIEKSTPSGLVVCCRLNEYRWLPERLKLNAAICLEPLTKDEVSKYLANGGSKLAALRKAVNTDAVLEELTQTPLLLSIMSLAYQGIRDDELSTQKGNSAEERRKQIFHLYIEQVFRRKGTSSLAFSREKTIGWLSWVAGKMREHSQSVFLVEGLQPSWLGTKAKRAAYGTIVALSLSLTFPLIYGLVCGMICGPRVGLFLGLISGLSIFLGIRLGCWSGSESPLKNGLNSALIGGLIAAASACWLTAGWLSVGLNVGLDFGSKVGWIFGMAVWLIGGAICGLGVSSLNHITLVEAISWKWNQFWKRTIPGLIVGLSFGSAIGYIVALWSGVSDTSALSVAFLVLRPVFGLALGLVSGLVGGFTDRVKVDKASPNQGINLSLKNSLVVMLVIGPIVGLVAIVAVLNIPLATDPGLPLAARLGVRMVGGLGVQLSVGLIAGLIAGLNRGGSAVIKHYALRLILWRKGHTPFNFIEFLDYCAKLIFLKKVGGGYIFIHRMLLDYFAELTPEKRPQETPKSRN
jgi:hypothetical protein